MLIVGIFAMFYILAVIAITTHFGVGYSRERPLTSTAAMLTASVAASAVGTIAGELWSLLAEGYRVSSNNHISYRAARIPGTHHRTAVFVGALILFWIVACRPRRSVD